MAKQYWRRAAYWALVVVTAFQALTAVGGGLAMLATDGLGMPRSLLVNGPFLTFTIPGIILLVAVGGTQSVALALLILRRQSALLCSAVAGFGMVIWIFVEVGMIGTITWLQAVYFVTGVVQLILVLALLGVVGWLPHESLRRLTTAHEGSRERS